MLFCYYHRLVKSYHRLVKRSKQFPAFWLSPTLSACIWFDKNCAHLFFSPHIHPAKTAHGLKKRQIEKKALQKKGKAKKNKKGEKLPRPMISVRIFSARFYVRF